MWPLREPSEDEAIFFHSAVKQKKFSFYATEEFTREHPTLCRVLKVASRDFPLRMSFEEGSKAASCQFPKLGRQLCAASEVSQNSEYWCIRRLFDGLTWVDDGKR